VLSELLWEAVDRLMQMLGGRGYLEANLAPQLLRDARVLRILEGPSEALYAHLGALVRLPGNPIAQAVEHYGSPALASELAAALAELPAPGSGAWQDGRHGEFAAWTLLAATARGDAVLWARCRLDGLARTIRAENAAAAACPPGSALLARVAQHALAIGDVEQAAPGEACRLDPFLRQAAPAVVVEDVPVPEAPSSLELVRACLQRWLREGGLGEGLAGKPEPDALAAEEWGDTMPVGPARAATQGCVEPDGAGLALATREECTPALSTFDASFGDDALQVDIALEAAAELDGWTVDTPFSDLGIDSLASVPLALEIEQASGVPVSAELLYDYPTVRLLAGYLDEWRDEHRT
jgi:acyl carrier protein